MNKILIANNYLNVPKSKNLKEVGDITLLGTIISNMAYYGFIPSDNAYKALEKCSSEDLKDFWKETESALKELTAANKKMGKFVVYKNFPKEVLDMSESQYWISQLLMYLGVENKHFTQDKKSRSKLKEIPNLKVLSLSNKNTLEDIFQSLIKNTSRWSDIQELHAKELLVINNIKMLDLNSFSFKENGIILINESLKMKAAKENALKQSKQVPLYNDIAISLSDATDVLRLAAAMSDGDISLREKCNFKKFNRPERRILLKLLNESSNLVEDMGIRKNQFKTLLSGLHPGDYNFVEVNKAYNLLYNNKIKTFNSKVENLIFNKDKSVLELLKSRPGDFMRRFHKMYASFDKDAVMAFQEIVPELKTIQLLKIDKYLETINKRKNLMFAPKGNWSKVQIIENKKAELKKIDSTPLREFISKEIGSRLNKIFPDGVKLGKNLSSVKLQTNDQELANYGRGTQFEIPAEMTFIRTASYWQNKTEGNNWFDNGWNFFDKDWNPIGTCCWNHTHDQSKGAIFSGDPTNSKDLKGRACQMIDLDLNQMHNSGIKYAVWNILAYSRIKFSEATEVLATLQWGEKPQKGNLFEPSRAQMIFPITGDSLTKYIAYIDIEERKLVYIDANLSGSVMSAGLNQNNLKETMPAYLEYLNSLPSVEDLFSHAKNGIVPILYSDKDLDLPNNALAYVFKPENSKNNLDKLDLSEILDSGKIVSKKIKLTR